MTLSGLALDCRHAIACRVPLYLEKLPGAKMPRGFPRGELLCINHLGLEVRAYDPRKMEKWVVKYDKGLA